MSKNICVNIYNYHLNVIRNFIEAKYVHVLQLAVQILLICIFANSKSFSEPFYSVHKCPWDIFLKGVKKVTTLSLYLCVGAICQYIGNQHTHCGFFFNIFHDLFKEIKNNLSALCEVFLYFLK